MYVFVFIKAARLDSI